MSLRVALAALGEHRLRTALGAIGVAMAVAMTLASAAVNEGARQAAQAEVDHLGIDTVVVHGPAGSLSHQDALALAQSLPQARAISPILEIDSAAKGTLRTRSAKVTGVTADLEMIRPVRLTAGRFIAAADEFDGAQVAVIGELIGRELFGHAAINARLRIAREWFTVIGIASADSADAERIFVPISALLPRRLALHPSQPVSAVWVRMAPGANEESHLRQVLARRHASINYDIVVARDLLQSRDRTQHIFIRVTATSAFVLFLLGGAAITNGLLSSVFERTREIGLRRAVGATRRQIVAQFLFEALVISGAGAAAGTAAGTVLILLTGHRGWAVSLPGAVVAIIPVAAALMALAAGTYPAMRAASIQPIDALSRE